MYSGRAARNCLSFIVFLLPLALFCGCGSSDGTDPRGESQIPRVAVIKVARRNIANDLTIASDFLPFQEIDAYAKVSGYIKNLYVDWGTHVRKGELLAVLEIPELEQQLRQDEASVRRAEKDMARSRQDLKSAQSSYEVADITFKRMTGVQKTNPGLIAQQEIDVAQGRDAEASAGASAARYEVDSAEESLLSMQAALERDKATYSYTRITAPFDGVVTQIYAYTGALLPAGTSSDIGNSAVCHLAENNLLRLVIPVPERAVPDVHLGETVQVEVSSLHKTFQGKVARISDRIDTQTRTMHTEVSVPNARYELVPGMYAVVKIPLRTAKNALTVPIQTVDSAGNGQGYVLVVDKSNKIDRRSVSLGIQTATEAEITSGLEEDDLVVFGERSQYRVGEVVSPKLSSTPENAR